MKRVPLIGPAPGPRKAPQLEPLSPVTSPYTNAARHEFKPGDRVEALGNFGKPMATFGTVQEVEEYSVAVLWDGGGHMKLGGAWIKKTLQ